MLAPVPLAPRRGFLTPLLDIKRPHARWRDDLRDAAAPLKRPVEVGGTVYPSLAEACQKLGVSTTRIYHWIDGMAQDVPFEEQLKRVFPRQNNKTGARAIVVEGVRYPSIRQASITLDIAEKTIRKMVERREATLCKPGS